MNSPFYLFYIKEIESSSPYQYQKRFNSKCQSVKTVFIGSSHLEASVNDFDFQNSFNFSSSGQSFEESYLILKNIMSPTLKKVVLSFSPFSFFQTNKMPVLNNTYFEYPLQSDPMIMRYILDYTKYARFFIKPFRSKSSKTKIDFIDHARVKQQIHFQYEQMNYGTKYYNKIIKLSKENGFDLIFITTPFSKEYYDRCIEKKSWLSAKTKISKDAEENNFSYYNFEDIFINEPLHHSLFRDSDHLNSLGRKKFRDQLYPIVGYNLINFQ